MVVLQAFVSKMAAHYVFQATTSVAKDALNVVNPSCNVMNVPIQIPALAAQTHF